MMQERNAGEVGSRAGERLALYQYPSCPFCWRVRRVIDDLGADVEMRDVLEDPQHMRDLVAARGRRTVPVLRITSEDEDRWLPESADIVRYLRERYGR